jgi:polar amino acid transport system permease protein
MSNDSPAREHSGRALSWTPSQRELERQASRTAIGRKKALIATVSSVIVIGSLIRLIVTSPGWQSVKETFFDWSYGAEVLGVVAKSHNIKIS